MKLSLPAGLLDKALARTERVIERRNTIPILSNIRLAARPGLLEITGTDLDIEVRTTIEAEVSEPGETTLPAAVLKQIVAKSKTGEISIELEGGETAKLAAGRAKWNLQALPASDYPDLNGGEFPANFPLAAADLVRIATKLSFAISTEETRYYLNGVYFHQVGESLVATATDGHRLGRLRLPLPEGAGGMPNVIIPRKAIVEIEKITGAAEAGAIAMVELSDTKIRITLGNTVLTSKLIDGTFPDYTRVIPPAEGSEATLDTSALRAAVDRVSTIASERGRAVKLSFVDGQVTLACTNPDAGTASDTIEGKLDGASIEIGFNARYVADALDRIDTPNVILHMANPGAPARLHEPGKANDYLIILMPMRV
jgi:DNA polymerase-3 subunit beta